MRSAAFIGLTASLAGLSQAVPTPESGDVQKREIVSSVLNSVGSLFDLAEASPTNSNIFSSLISEIEPCTATATQSSVQDAMSTLSSMFASKPTPSNLALDLVDTAVELVAAGLTLDNVATIIDDVEGSFSAENSMSNTNSINPSSSVYPKAGSSDAPYSLTESQLREAIYIPSDFQYGASGAPNPIVLVPGTGNSGYTSFVGNYIPLLQQNKIADPVWLNLPEYGNGDVQANAEHVAYAINYISGISNNSQVSVATWSQGSIDAQWAFKYWPSTRCKVTDLVAFSPDYHGTVLANLIAVVPLPPAYLQQEYTSNLITTLRSNTGDSAYVPTTNVYSSFYDEIVEPQTGSNASGYLLDYARNVGVSNNEVQSICPGQSAGFLYTHEGVLYNPLGYALFVDALTHSGPASVSRIQSQLSSICSTLVTEGLDLADFLLTEEAILIAVVTLIFFSEKVTTEPAIMCKTPPALPSPFQHETRLT